MKLQLHRSGLAWWERVYEFGFLQEGKERFIWIHFGSDTLHEEIPEERRKLMAVCGSLEIPLIRAYITPERSTEYQEEFSTTFRAKAGNIADIAYKILTRDHWSYRRDESDFDEQEKIANEIWLLAKAYIEADSAEEQI